MKWIRLLATLAVCSLAFPALAGDDEWDYSNVNGGGSSSLTASATGTTPVIDTRLCSGGVIVSDDANVTWDIHYCRTEDATTCTTAVNLTSPIPAGSPGVEFDRIAHYVRLEVISMSGDPTFTLQCSK